MYKIAFFGASVTHQKNGYSRYFTELNPNFCVRSFGYGGMHMYDAGVCCIDEVMEFQPDYCFIDWLSPAYIGDKGFPVLKEYINALLHRFFEKNVKLIFLIFPDTNTYKCNLYKEAKDYLEQIGIPVIDLTGAFTDLDQILRDNVHTTNYGSDKYAKFISDKFLNKIFLNHKAPHDFPPRNKYCDIKFLDIDIEVFNRMVLCGQCEVVGIKQILGPHGGLIKIDEKIIRNWDKWCYYERENISLKFFVDGLMMIEVLKDDFDRSASKVSIDWGAERSLKVKGIYYTGKELNVLDYN